MRSPETCRGRRAWHASILPAEERGDGPAGETPAARSNARQRTPAWFVTTQRDLTQPESSRISSYIPLRVHSYYSFLDSTLSPTDIVEWAARHDHLAVALTDSGNLHGAVEFVQAAQKAGIRPILGVKLSSGNHPLLLYVESARGYQNLCHLLSRHAANRDGEEDSVAAQQRRPFRREELAGLTEGLIAVSSDTSLAELFCGSFYQLARREDLLADRKLLLDAPRVSRVRGRVKDLAMKVRVEAIALGLDAVSRLVSHAWGQRRLSNLPYRASSQLPARGAVRLAADWEAGETAGGKALWPATTSHAHTCETRGLGARWPQKICTPTDQGGGNPPGCARSKEGIHPAWPPGHRCL